MKLPLTKLYALDYPEPDDFDPTDDEKFRRLVNWIEDEKLHFYNSEDRLSLRDIKSGDWKVSFMRYLSDLECPLVFDPELSNDNLALSDWLLSTAVAREYSDKNEVLEGINSSFLKEEPLPSGSTNPLDNLDFESVEFKNGVVELSKLLNIPLHIDHKLMMKAVCLLIEDKLTSSKLEKANADAGQRIEKLSLSEVPVGFETPDTASADAARILRLLHIQNLRDLQNQINYAIVQVQCLTADPKTNERLGKVGR